MPSSMPIARDESPALAGGPMPTKALHQSGAALYVEMSFALVNDPQSGTLGAVAIAREPREKKPPTK